MRGSGLSRFISWFSLRGVPVNTPDFPGRGTQVADSRRAVIEWEDSPGKNVSQRTLLKADQLGNLRAFVRRPLPTLTADILEMEATYPVEIMATTPVAGGFELKLKYIGSNRRREDRSHSHGAALLECGEKQAWAVEVLDVSMGGMQVFSSSPLTVGTSIRVCGKSAVCLGVVRHCSPMDPGFRIGLQFFGETRRERSFREINQ